MDYLEIRELYHHGIKGQRWGIRRFNKKESSDKKKSNSKKKVAAGLTIASAGIVAGSLWLKNHQAKINAMKVHNDHVYWGKIGSIVKKQNAVNRESINRLIKLI